VLTRSVVASVTCVSDWFDAHDTTAAAVSSGLTALVSRVPPRQLLPSSQIEKSRVITPLLPLAATGRALNPLAPPTMVSGGHPYQQQHYQQAQGAHYNRHHQAYAYHSSA
jgi:hypothetical protein